MRTGLVEAIVRGQALPWACAVAIWVGAAALLLLQGRARPSPARALGLLALGSVISAAGLLGASALAVPRVRWRDADAGGLLGDGAASWRSLEGPAALAIAGGKIDVAIPARDPAGRWVLVGLLSGRPVDGLAPAPEAGGEAGAARGDAAICLPGGVSCRPWPTGWPAPGRLRALSQLEWSHHGAMGALAFEPGAGELLRGKAGGGDGPALEIVGDLAGGAWTSGAPALEVRLLDGDRLRGARVIARPGPGAQGAERRPGAPDVEPIQRWALQRADVSLSAPRRAFEIVLPLLVLGALGLPVGAGAFLVAPAWLAASLRRRGAVRRELSAPLVLDPLPEDKGARAPSAARVRPAAAREDADLGDALLPAGAIVTVAIATPSEGPVASSVWYELPAGEPPEGGVPGADAAVPHEVRGTRRRVGLLIPAEAGAFRRTARGWLSSVAQPIAIALAGIAAACPAVVALANLLAAR